MVTRPACCVCWIRGREQAADVFLRLQAGQLRPVCTDCLLDFNKRNLPTTFTQVSFDDGVEEWVVQEVHEP